MTTTTSQTATETIREAIEPMRADLEKATAAHLTARAMRYAKTMTEARTEVLDEIRLTPAAEARYNLPAWMGRGVWIFRGRTEAEAMAEAEMHLQPWSLATREAGESHRYHREVQERIAQDKAAWRLYDAGQIPAEAARLADAEIRSTVAKLARKVDGLGPATGSRVSGRTTDSFTIELDLATGATITMRTQMILNHSTRGRLFNQWPTRLYRDGKATSEAALKA